MFTNILKTLRMFEDLLQPCTLLKITQKIVVKIENDHSKKLAKSLKNFKVREYCKKLCSDAASFPDQGEKLSQLTFIEKVIFD